MNHPNVLILTPVKDAAHEAEGYVERLLGLTYPRAHTHVGVLTGDSVDDSEAAFAAAVSGLRMAGFATAQNWHRDFGYRTPEGVSRHEPSVQLPRRINIAKARNHLLMNALTADTDWVLWIDVDVIEYQHDIIETLLALRRDILHPHCVREWGGYSFDQNAWRDRGELHLDQMRGDGFFAELHAVGGTMLLVRADCHRDGLIWPTFRYGLASPLIRTDPATIGRQELGEVESEGLGILANDMGFRCWGLPQIEVRHR